MQENLKLGALWLRKVAICLAFFGFLSVRDAQANGSPPLITVSPVSISVYNGDTATFTVTVGASQTPVTVTWFFKNSQLSNNVSTISVPIVGTTISTLTIPNCSGAQGGNYKVKVENGGGAATGTANLTVLSASNVLTTVSFLPSQCGMTNGGFQLQLLKPATSNCVVEATTDFVNWVPIYTNTSGTTNISCLDFAATNLVQRYYRARFQ